MAPPLKGRPQQFPNTPQGWAQRWGMELDGARAEVKKWQEQAKAITKRYLDEREGEERRRGKRVNLFHANVETVQAIIYGRTPQVTVTRRFADAQDDVARVAGELFERLLNSDLEREGDTCAEAYGYALQDRLLGGLGQVRVRYEYEEGRNASSPDMDEAGGDPRIPQADPGATRAPMAAAQDMGTRAEWNETPGVAPSEVAGGGVPVPDESVGGDGGSHESVSVDYVHWRDFLWSPARVWHEVRWVAFRSEMMPEQTEKRFGKKVADAIPYAVSNEPTEGEEKRPNPWARAEVWEVWDKTTRTVYWVVEGYGEVLDSKKDPWGLTGFFPCPPPMLANLTTSKVLPRPDFTLAEDQYDEIDDLSARIRLLVSAIRAAGVYNSADAGTLANLLDDTASNKMFPIDSWALFAEKGGLRGITDWLPLEAFVNAIAALMQQKEAAKAELYEVTGMSDIMRGQAGKANVTATEQQIKAQYGSVRVQALQDMFARWASRVQQLKAELCARFLSPDTIREMTNADFMEDAKQPGLMDAAIRLMKDEHHQYRVEVKPEAVSMTDFAQLRQERMEAIGAVAQFITSAQPLVQALPGSMPHLLGILQWAFAAMKGGAEVEGILDQAIQDAEAQAQQAAQQPPAPDPKLVEIQAKNQFDMQREQQKAENALRQTQAEVLADGQREVQQREQNVMEAAQKAQIQASFKQTAEPGRTK